MDLSILDDTDIINVFGEDLNIDINKEVLPKRDQQQNHSTYLYRLTNAASDSHNTSNNYSIQSIKNYESLQKCTSETNARQRIDKSTLESKKTILQEKFEDGNKNSSNKLGKPSVLNGHTKNNEMCLSHTLTPNNILSCDVTTSSKRVFPGPAGALPKLVSVF